MASNTSLGGIGRPIATALSFGVLGDVTVADGTQPLSLGGQKQRVVMAMLIAAGGRRVPSDRLVEAVYGDPGAYRGRRRVQTYVSTLRSLVGDVIVKDGSGWRLAVERAQIDAFRFEDAYESVRDPAAIEPEAVATVLRDALALWRGHPYADIEAHGLLDAETARLNEIRVSTQAARLDADLAAGRDADLIGEIESLMIEHPYQERFRAHHMLALYRAGRQREALRSFESLRTLLIEEIGADPSPELRDLERRILEQDPGLALRPTTSIRRRAILVADSGDPLELARLPAREREASIQRCAELIRVSTTDTAEGEVHIAGNAIYAVFENVALAVSAVTNALARADGAPLRLAIDWGDLEASDEGVNGPPVSRVAVLVSVAHTGQVLLSAEAQQVLTEQGGTIGVRFEMLGSYDLVGIEKRTPIFQLLVGDQSRSFPPLVTDRTPPPLPGRGERAVPGYELRDAIGLGSVGTLHRAYQPAVGREVLIEVIGRAEASNADFIRRFEADAQRLTLLDHPNVSPVLDYWREPGGAFVVYRFHRGGLLDTTDHPDGPRIIDQVGAALAGAHSLGIVHGSLRPDRIALDESGNAYLLGFPIAGVTPRSNPAYPAYIAPETLAGSAPTVATDVYALGVLAQELLTGEELPADAPVASGSSVIARAVSEDPADRVRSVAEFLVALNPAGVESPESRFTETRNPYKGLAAFHEADSQDFFGRDAVIDELIESMSDSHLLAVVGPSGIGKSSVVRAGLVPRLRAGALPGSERMVITDMLPGSHPFVELQRALDRVAVDVPGELRTRLADHAPEALAGLESCLPDGSELLLIIDQFEELFTMANSATASEFLALLVATVDRRRARIVVTMRADFLDRPLLHSEFGELLRTSMVTVRSPNATELVETITRPARTVGVTVDGAVAERMSREVLDRPGALPLLQHALSDLFDARTSDRIDLELFEQRGGVTGSLARRAESVFDTLGPEHKPAVKQIFLRLLTVDEGTPTRRRVRLSTLDDLHARPIIDMFVRSRLLVLDTDPDTRAPTVEVAHEALLTHWPRLAAWIDTAREDLTFARRLDESVREWEANDQDDAYLFAGGRLAQYEAWRSTSTMTLDQRRQQFLDDSVVHDQGLQARARRRRNLITGALATAAIIATVLGLVALRNANQANEKEAEARAESLAANAIIALESDPELAGLLSLEALDTFDTASSVAAVHQAMQHQRTEMIIPPPEPGFGASATIDPAGEHVAVVGLGSSTLSLWPVGAPEPRWSVALAEDGAAFFWDFMQLWFSSDGRRIYVPLIGGPEDASQDAIGVYTVDSSSGEVLDFLQFDCLVRVTPPGAHFVPGDAPLAAEWGETLESGECDGDSPPSIGVVDIASGDILFETKIGSYGRPPTLSADGRLLAIAAFFEVEGEMVIAVRVFDTASGEIVYENVSEWDKAVISQDGTRLLTGFRPTYLVDIASGERLQAYQGDFGRVSFTLDEQRVIGTAGSGALVVFDTETGAELARLRGHTSRVGNAAVDAGGDRIVSSSYDSARVWGIGFAATGHLLPIVLDAVDDLILPVGIATTAGDQFFPDAIADSDDHVLLRRGVHLEQDLEDRTPYRAELLHMDGGAVRSDDVWLAELGPAALFRQPIISRGGTTPTGEPSTAEIGVATLVDLSTGAEVELAGACRWYWLDSVSDPKPSEGCTDGVASRYRVVSFSDDGTTVMATDADGWNSTAATPQSKTTTIWNTRTGERIAEFEGWGLALSPDGETLILQTGTIDDDHVARVVDVASGREIARFDIFAPLDQLAYDTKSGLVVGEHFGLVVIDPETWTVSTPERPSGGDVTDVAVSPDGQLVATVDRDEFLVVWDLDSLSIVAELPVVGGIGEGLHGVAFLDDETLLVAPERGDALLTFTLDPSLLRELALDTLNRGFRPEECRTYDIDPCRTLDEMRSGG